MDDVNLGSRSANLLTMAIECITEVAAQLALHRLAIIARNVHQDPARFVVAASEREQQFHMVSLTIGRCHTRDREIASVIPDYRPTELFDLEHGQFHLIPPM
jgi:hypothetical protein